MQFEYLIVSYDPNRNYTKIMAKPDTYSPQALGGDPNDLGKDRWELVGVSPLLPFPSQALCLFFKRELKG